MTSGPRVTLRDVAEDVGVAISTASRAFSRPEMVHPETLDRVRDAAERLGFRPTRVARPLDTALRTIDLMVQDILIPSHAQLMRGVARHSKALGYGLSIGMADGTASSEQQHVRRTIGKADGLILASRWLSDSEILEIARATPLVLFNRNVKGVNRVLIDATDAVRKAVAHLVSLGHRTIYYVPAPRRSWAHDQRWTALQAAASRCRITIASTEELAGCEKPTGDPARLVAEHRPSAVIVYNDLIALKLVRSLQGLGLRVPEDISVLTFDESLKAELSAPPLSTVLGPTQHAGKLAVELLAAAIEDRRVIDTELRVPSTFVMRGSTARAEPSAH